MNKDSFVYRTLSPIQSPLSVSLGIDQSAEKYRTMLALLPKSNANFSPIHQEHSEHNYDYDDIDIDSRDHRLFLWFCESIPEIKIHVFPNNISVVELELNLSCELSPREVEKLSQKVSLEKIKQVHQQFLDDLKQLSIDDSDEILKFAPTKNDLKIHWISRTLLLNTAELKQEHTKSFIHSWLKNTQRPEDAKDLIEGHIEYSMTWLNYVIIGSSEDRQLIETMILAQYFYTAQEDCNKLLKQAIDSAYSSTDLSVAEKKLATSRVLSRLHQIDLHEHKKFLNRFKRKLLEEILTCWDFEQLTENGLRMIEVCSSRLEEADNKKRERSTIMTDLLLVTLSFFAVFELSLYLTELSREMMSRPALAFNDENGSFFLKLIAGIPVDVMFAFGFGLTLALVIVYRKIKSK